MLTLRHLLKEYLELDDATIQTLLEKLRDEWDILIDPEVLEELLGVEFLERA